MKSEKIGVAAITHRFHKANGILRMEEVKNLPKKWLEVGHCSEPRGTGNWELGLGKMGEQLFDLHQKNAFDNLPGGIEWILMSMDTTIRDPHGEQINQPDGNPMHEIEKIGQKMIRFGKTGLMASGILTTSRVGVETKHVGWRDAVVTLSPVVALMLAEPERFVKLVEKGNISPKIITPHSNGGVRWDKLIGTDPRALDITGPSLVVEAGGKKIVVDGWNEAREALDLVGPFLRSVPSELVGGALALHRRLL